MAIQFDGRHAHQAPEQSGGYSDRHGDEVEIGPLADAMFAIPDGWKRQKK